MKFRLPRCSIQTLMILVGLTAGGLVAGRWVVVKIQLDLVRADYERDLRRYEEGRVLADVVVQRSRRLLEAQRAWTRDQPSRIEAIEDHLRRLAPVLVQAKKDLADCFCRGCYSARIEVTEIEVAMDEARVLLARETGRDVP